MHTFGRKPRKEYLDVLFRDSLCDSKFTFSSRNIKQVIPIHVILQLTDYVLTASFCRQENGMTNLLSLKNKQLIQGLLNYNGSNENSNFWGVSAVKKKTLLTCSKIFRILPNGNDVLCNKCQGSHSSKKRSQ